MRGTWQEISAAEFARLREGHGPLADAVRELIDATIRSGAGEDVIAAAATAVRAVTESLAPLDDEVWRAARRADTGQPLLFTNPAVGFRNPIAPPMVINYDSDGRCWSEFTLGAAYEGPVGTVHGGVAALLLDHLLGEAATAGLREPKFTGTISLRYLRPTPLGRLSAQAWVDSIEGYKTYARGVISDAEGPTVEAEGVFIMPAWARESQESQ